MLKIFEDNGSLIIKEIDEAQGVLLGKPLHKIFLRTYLNGSYNATDQSCGIPTCSVDSLLLIIDHFNKYHVEVDLDNYCKKLLEKRNKDAEDFNLLIKNALDRKVNINDDDITQIQNLLYPEFKRNLTVLQSHAVSHLLAIQNGANFSVPGSGKTTIALAFYLILKKLKIVDRLFIIGPASVFEPWETEYNNCFDIKPNALRIAGKQKQERKRLYLKINSTEIFLNTYHSASRDIQEIKSLLSIRKFLLVLDESHYVKKPTGGKLSDTILELSKYATRKLILTGTPMPAGLADLWSQMSFLWLEKLPLGPVNKYLANISREDTSAQFELVKSRIFPFFFRITKSQLNLPKPNFHIKRFDLASLQSLIYKGVSVQFLNELDLTKKEKNVFRELRRARAIRLLQIASNPSLLNTNCEEFLIPPLNAEGMDIEEIIKDYSKLEIPSKIGAAVTLADEIIQGGNKVVIWSMFVQNLFMLNNLLSQYNPVIIYGGIPYANEDEVDISREALIKKFKNETDCKILIANPAACAESISLHKVCHYAIYLDRSFNCAHYIQSMDRIHRLGLQEHDSTHYYLLMANSTIDEVVEQRLTQKIKNLNYILEGELPGIIPGYWNNDLGEEEDIDFNLVDNHIRQIVK